MAPKKTPAERLNDVAEALRLLNIDITDTGISRSLPEPGDLYDAIGALSTMHVKLTNLTRLLGDRAKDLTLDDDLYCTTRQRPDAVLRGVAGYLDEYAGGGEALDAAWADMGTIGRTAKAA